ncbi:hypothetical protein ElyMa_001884000 [Elysia marginata]|uniref:Uncharacterized protein n=1 Tax=Elysia marginata TaxID=1093978 RepID=A0AAV4EQG2_9GAST|nr:hypothetical protein ElyMa_001884000 [Elysia marginata]
MDTQTKSFTENVKNLKRPGLQTPAKRRAVDFFETIAQIKKYINFESAGEGTICDLCPFKIYDELEGVLGKDPYITKTNRGLLMEVRDKDIEKKLLSLKAMAGVPLRATPDRFINTSKVVVSHPDVKRCIEDEFVKKNCQASHSPSTSKFVGVRRRSSQVPSC